MLRVAIVVGVAGLLAGCASYNVSGSGWAKPGAGFQQVTFDEMDCARLGQTASRTPDLVLGGVFDVARLMVESVGERQAYERCMTGRGYRPMDRQAALTLSRRGA